MPLGKPLIAKWDRRLNAWSTWTAEGGKLGPRISSAYKGMAGSNGNGNQITPIPDELLDTYRLMLILQREHGKRHLYRALVVWAHDEGTRGQQAASLSLHADTYRYRAEQAIAYLELLSRIRHKVKRSTHNPTTTPCAFPFFVQNPATLA
jgi:hypothetical protein